MRSAGTFDTKKEALAAIQRQDVKLGHGTWIDPAAGRITFGEYAMDVWLPSRHLEVSARAGYVSNGDRPGASGRASGELGPGSRPADAQGDAGPAITTRRSRGPCTPSTRTSSMSLVALGPEIQVRGRCGWADSSVTASGTVCTTWSARTTRTCRSGTSVSARRTWAAPAVEHDGAGLGDGHPAPGEHGGDGVELGVGERWLVAPQRLQ